VRDAAEGERVVQAALCSLLYVGRGPYIVTHERESAGGFVDIVFEPHFALYPEMRHGAIVELKYVKPSEKLTKPKLAAIRREAVAQLERYAADHDLARAWHLREQGGEVELHRIVLVFHGGDVALCEEVGD